MKRVVEVKHAKAWITARRVIQAAAFIVFSLAVLLARQGSLDPALINSTARLSPFSMLANLISSRTFLAGSALSLILLLSSLVVGRAWCGWLCPLGTLLELFSFSKWKKRRKPLSENWRAVKYVLLITTLLAAVFSNLTLLFLDPITIAIRTLVGVVYPAVDRVLYWLEGVFIQVPVFSSAVSHFDQWLRPAVFPTSPAPVKYPWVFGITFLLLIGLNLFAERFWCRYLCPLGALLGLGAKSSLIKRRVSETCTHCRLCERRCPTGTIRSDRAFESDPSECTLCMNCFSTCSNSGLEFTLPPRLAPWRSYDPNRRIFLSSLGTIALGAVALRVDWFHLSISPFRLRPPGAQSTDFLTACIRCGLCVSTCPTHVLQVDLSSQDVESFSAPLLIPRMGFCDYGCNHCGQICPVQAIPPLPLEQKRLVVIGKAAIDQSRCLPWSKNISCVVCEEMCPTPRKAIELTRKTITGPEGNSIEILLPHVKRGRCIGCGTCEFKCPVEGEAAIRVYTS